MSTTTPDAREVALAQDTVDNWDEYDTVFLGYPIWWGIAAWPVDDFVTANDFTGKTVIPFCTSASSGPGRERRAPGRGGRDRRLARGQRSPPA